MAERKVQTAYRLDPEMIQRMKDLKEREGIPESEQVRRALQEWLDRREASGKRKRAR